MNIPKSVWWLVIGMALNITGSSFLWPLNTIYMKQELGKSLTVAGLVLMINSFGMVIGNLLGGSLFDKLGGYKTILIGTFTCLCSTTLLNFFHGWALVCCMACNVRVWWRNDYSCDIRYGWSSVAKWRKTNV